jgi:hypothetical protein
MYLYSLQIKGNSNKKKKKLPKCILHLKLPEHIHVNISQLSHKQIFCAPQQSCPTSHFIHNQAFVHVQLILRLCDASLCLDTNASFTPWAYGAWEADFLPVISHTRLAYHLLQHCMAVRFVCGSLSLQMDQYLVLLLSQPLGVCYFVQSENWVPRVLDREHWLRR